MHLLGCPHDGIDRTSLYAKCAANAVLLIDDGDSQRLMCSTAQVQRQNREIKQAGQCLNACIASGRAAIDRRPILSDRLRVWQAALVATLGALRLWQKRVDVFCQWSGL